MLSVSSLGESWDRLKLPWVIVSSCRISNVDTKAHQGHIGRVARFGRILPDGETTELRSSRQSARGVDVILVYSTKAFTSIKAKRGK